MRSLIIRAKTLSLRLAVFGALAVVLIGCIESNHQLFDPDAGARPIPPGRYRMQQYVVGNWVDEGSGRLRLSGALYNWKDGPDAGSTQTGENAESDPERGAEAADAGRTLTLHGIGNNLFVVMSDYEEKYVYDLFEVTVDGVFRYAVECRDVLRLPSIRSIRMNSGCSFASAEDLKNVLRAYATRKFPAGRYVPENRREIKW